MKKKLPPNNGTTYYSPNLIDPFDPFEDNFFDKDSSHKIECECGSEKTYGAKTNLHSFWCPKYKGK